MEPTKDPTNALAMPLQEELEESREWGRTGLTVRVRGGGGVAARVSASGELPLSPADAFQLMSHPDNAAIFRGIERCTFRKVLWAAADAGRGGGQQTVEVENESDWHFLWFKGSIRTRMVVVEDPAAGTINVRLAPTGGNAPLQHLNAMWRFAPGRTASSCRMSLEQEVHPRGLPPIFYNGFRAMAAMQVRKTFEDLYAEALRMNAGCPSLPPYHLVAHKEVAPVAASPTPSSGSGSAGDGAACGGACADDPASVLAAAYEADSAASTTTGASPTSSAGGRGRILIRPGGLRSHPISSLLDLPCLAGVTGADLAAEAAANAAKAAAEAAAAAAAPAPTSLRQRAYALLQKVWLASNAALGAAPNAVAELEEMAVLV